MDVNKGIEFNWSQNRLNWTTGSGSLCAFWKWKKIEKETASALSTVERQLEQSMDSKKGAIDYCSLSVR